MRSRRLTWILLSLLCLAGVCLLWQQKNGRDGSPLEKVGTSRSPRRSLLAKPGRDVRSDARAVRPYLSTASTNAANTNKFAYRLSNTAKSLDQLMRDDRAILLENALIDTRSPLNLSIPANLRATGDPGAYIVQARGPIDNAFRAMLAASGATIVSYIPNNAYLVRAPAGVANAITSSGFPVISYEPYYKISSSMSVTGGQKTFSSAPMGTNRAAGPSLLALAVKQKPLPEGTCLTLGLFSDGAAATVQQIEKLGGRIIAQDSSPFGPIVRVIPPTDWITLAQLPGVQIVEPYHPRIHANDLSRAAVGVSADTLVSSNYMNLTGKNVMVEVNDSGIDATHPDFQTGGGLPVRVIGDAPQSLVDTNGHGTHVAGIIAGNGLKSTTVTNAQGSILNDSGHGTNGQFRGKAPAATLFSMNMNASDQELQEAAALTNALISNNSWNYGSSSYDLAAASYDAAVRDALPKVTGSQPVLFVFSAGNSGAGNDNGGSGNADTILSPATAKNVITVGALEQLRNITNVVTNLDGSIGTPWAPMTDTSNQVASYSSRGNVGIGIEGTYGRFKPDVVAPGTFVVSTRSGQWDTNAYYNPTNYNLTRFSDAVDPGSKNFYSLVIPQNIVQLTIQLEPNIASPSPFPPLPILVWNGTSPRTSSPYQTGTGSIALPPLAITPVKATWEYAISNNTSESVNYDALVDIVTTNDLGNYYQILQGMNDSLGTSPEYYRYETGTSMAAADVSGVLALMQDYFTNTLRTTPSPALLKAMLINGARQTGYYDFQAQNSINYEGWGLINLPDALQPGITDQLNAGLCSTFILDQNPTNALATGDSQTFYVTVTDTNAQSLPLRITLAWTDPPGDPAAAIKLVNDLNLVVTNFDNPTNPIIYYGNDIGSGNTFNIRRTTNSSPNFDSINNVENVYITPLLGTNYSVTVMGYRVNVNAVTAQTNNFAGVYAPNVVQDYALVISSGNGQITNAMTVTTTPIVSNPTTDQQITYLSGANNNGPLLNQFVGANTPLMGTNVLLIPLTNPLTTIFTTNELNGVTNEQITIGMTNQWHFYVVTNTFASTNSAFTNTAFITFIPDTLSIPRMGVFAGSQANATRPEADIDIYVSTDSTLTNLDPTVINGAATNYFASLVGPSPNVSATVVGGSPAFQFQMASLGRGGTEYVVDTNSQPGEVYYIGVKSEDQMASEYAFMSVFSATPFSQINQNGSQTVNGVPLPVNIPDGSPAHPGSGYAFGIAMYPMDMRRVVVTNQIWHQNFGDLIGTLTLNGGNLDVLNNHDSLGNTVNLLPFVYDDSGQGDIPNSRLSDGPGSLNNFIGQQGNGLWRLTEVDDSLSQTGVVENVILTIDPHLANNGTITETIPGGNWDPNYPDWIDVPPGAVNLIITVTNLTGTAFDPGVTQQAVDLYVKFGSPPTLTSYDTNVVINPGTPATNSILIPSPLVGRYYFGVFNPSATPQTVSITADYSLPSVPAQMYFTSAGPVPILDDAVMDDFIPVSDNATIYSVDVGLCVDHPRISDLVFHLISPDGTRVLLMENRGGTTTNGMGGTVAVSTIPLIPLVTNSFYLVLTENTNLTTTPIKFAPPPFATTNDLFYLPEQSLDAFAGKNAQGMWTLEVQDDRAGASNNATLVSWQLRFIFTTPVVPPPVLPPSLLPTTSLHTARGGHTATLLNNGQVLVAGGGNSSGILSSAELYDPASGTWTMTGPMNNPRTQHTATLLTNGLVLVAGGITTGNGTYLSSAELYDPASGMWTPTGKMTYACWNPTATLLTNGQVLVAGGIGISGNPATNAELYDPTLGTWKATGPMHTPRVWDPATLLANGQVLIIGGYGGPGTGVNEIVTNAELYDPTLGTWTLTTSLPINARVEHVATLLPNGLVLVAGGYNTNNTYLTNSELYDPTLGTWTPTTGSMQSGHGGATATLLPNGHVLVAGGNIGSGGSLSIAELYDPTLGTWTPTSSLHTPRYSHTATLLANGKVLVVGGYGSGIALNSAELYDSASGTWEPTYLLHTPRYIHTATLLTNGLVLVAGGVDNAGNILNSAELYNPDPVSGGWTGAGSMTDAARYAHTATLLPNGKVLVVGGYGNSGAALSSAELYDPVSGWEPPTGSMAAARYFHTATLLPNGKVLVVGGYGSSGALRSAELYDPVSGWATTGSMTNARYFHTATLLPNGLVLVAAGYGNNGILSSAELYDPVKGTWMTTGSLNTPRYIYTATLLFNGQVLIAGGYGGAGSYLSSAELYDPASGVWTPTGSLNTARYIHTATLLLNGKVLVAGGDNANSILPDAELYDPVKGTNGTWTATSSLTTPRASPTATLLPNGKVLVTGGYGGSGNSGVLQSAELYDVGLGFSPAWQPLIATFNSPINFGDSLMLTGSQFRGVSEGSGGNSSQNSPADYPVVQLRSVESGQTLFLLATNWSVNSFASVPVTLFPPGYALVTMFVNGIPSASSIPNILLIGSMPTATILTTGSQPQTSSIQPGGIVYYAVLVPPYASYATNILVSATAPVNVWFNQNGLPTGMNSPGDFLLITNAPGTSVLSTNSVPLLLPGRTYYIGVQNTNSGAVTAVFEVDFGMITGSFSANVTSGGAQLQWTAPSDARFQMEWATNLSQPMVWMTNDAIITSSDGTFTFTDPGATNSPMRFYRLLQLP